MLDQDGEKLHLCKEIGWYSTFKLSESCCTARDMFKTVKHALGVSARALLDSFRAYLLEEKRQWASVMLTFCRQPELSVHAPQH